MAFLIWLRVKGGFACGTRSWTAFSILLPTPMAGMNASSFQLRDCYLKAAAEHWSRGGEWTPNGLWIHVCNVGEEIEK